MRSKLPKLLKLSGDLLSPLSTTRNSPIYIIGRQRTGTTWVASTLNTARGVKYFHEPFNPRHFPDSAKPVNKYLRGGDRDEKFAEYCREAFAGKIRQPAIDANLGWIYKRVPWWPGRVIIKDVNCSWALDWIDRHITPTIVIVIRHPCAFAASWFQWWGETKLSFQTLFNQPKLMSDYLQPFESVLKNAKGFWQKMGAYWGASYYVMLEQQRQHPDWIVLQHEMLCQDPVGEYSQLFDRLNLTWTAATDNLLQSSTTTKSNKPYITQRISAREPDKWKTKLTQQQIEEVRQFTTPFGIPYYQDF